MSFVENAVINNTITWTQSDSSRGDTLTINNGLVTNQLILSSGTGIGKVNAIFHISGALSQAGGSNDVITYNLHSLTGNILGNNTIINLSGGNLKCISISNLNTGSSDVFWAEFTGS